MITDEEVAEYFRNNSGPVPPDLNALMIPYHEVNVPGVPTVEGDGINRRYLAVPNSIFSPSNKSYTKSFVNNLNLNRAVDAIKNYYRDLIRYHDSFGKPYSPSSDIEAAIIKDILKEDNMMPYAHRIDWPVEDAGLLDPIDWLVGSSLLTGSLSKTDDLMRGGAALGKRALYNSYKRYLIRRTGGLR